MIWSLMYSLGGTCVIVSILLIVYLSFKTKACLRNREYLKELNSQETKIAITAGCLFAGGFSVAVLGMIIESILINH